MPAPPLGGGWGSRVDRGTRPPRSLLRGDRVEELALDLELDPALLQRRAVDEEGVFHALAERRDLRELQVDVMARQHACDRVQQAGAVAGGHAQQPALR